MTFALTPLLAAAAGLSSAALPESAADMLPPRATCRAMADFAQELRWWYKARQSIDPVRSYQYHEAAREADLLYAWWYTAWSIRAGHSSVGDGWVWECVDRRRALGRLMRAIGEEAWARGEWPPPGPFWRFPRDD